MQIRAYLTFSLNQNTCTFILKLKKNHDNNCQIFFYMTAEYFPMLGRLPVFFHVFIVAMMVCRWLVTISVDTKKQS